MYYAIFTPQPSQLYVYRLMGAEFQPVEPNQRGHFPLPELGVELGRWPGVYHNMSLHWLRWWDADGNLPPTADEAAAIETERAERNAQCAGRLAARLRALGFAPDALDEADATEAL